MSKERIFEIIKAPHVTEKATLNPQVVVLKVARDAKKPEIKQAVEQLMDVEVDSVRVVNVKGKTRMTRNGKGKLSDWRKAYVKLVNAIDADELTPGGQA